MLYLIFIDWEQSFAHVNAASDRLTCTPPIDWDEVCGQKVGWGDPSVIINSEWQNSESFGGIQQHYN